MSGITMSNINLIRLVAVILVIIVAIVAIANFTPSAEIECIKAKGTWKSDGMIYRPYCHWEAQK